MKITHVASLYAPHAGGIETMVAEMSQHYAAQGHEPSVITNQWPADLISQQTIDGIRVSRIVAEKAPLEAPEFDDLLSVAKSFYNTLKDQPRPDILHIIGVRRPLPLFSLMMARHLQVPVIATVAGSEVPDANDKSIADIWKHGRELLRGAYPQFDVVNTVSSAISNNLAVVVPELGVVPVMPVGIDSAKYESIPASERFSPGSYIFSLRRLVYSKGIDLLIEGFAQFAQTNNELSLVIAGDGPEKDALVELATKLGIYERVNFIGQVELDEGIALMKSAAVTVVPSRSEGGGLVNTEANAVGCPLIVADVGGVKEYTTNEAALIIKSESPQAICDALINTIKLPANTNDRVANGKIFAQTLSWNNLIPRYLKMYSDAIEAYQPRPFDSWSPKINKLNEVVKGVR